ncbi:hypothetical protein MIMGU_mgv1a0127361mg, partial [Erythranthe guttata]
MANSEGSREILHACLVLGLLALINVVRCDNYPDFQSRRSLIGETIFDVTKFGAKGDGITDDAMAIIKAWRAACTTVGAAKVLIPRGDFVAGEVVMAGPCTAQKPITIEIQGNLLAYDDMSVYTRGAWIMIEKVDGLVVTGGGTINGRGKEVWQYFTKGSPPLPV